MAANKRPSEITVLGVPFDVRYAHSLKDENGEQVAGLMHGPKRLIEICLTNNATPSLVESTLAHEWCHAVFYVSGWSEMFKDDQEEGIVLVLENALLQAFKRR